MNSIGHQKCDEKWKEQYSCRMSCVLSDACIWDLSKLRSPINSIILVKNYFFFKNYLISEGVVYHNVLYYQQLSIAC